MTSFVIRRLIQAVVLIKCVLIFIFLLLHLTGDPIAVMAPEEATQEELVRLRQLMGLDKPLPIQYGIFFLNALRGDFGESYEHGESALKIVLEHLPAITAASFQMARLMRSEMLEALRQDYIMTARAKGAAEMSVVFRRALKNSASLLSLCSAWTWASCWWHGHHRDGICLARGGTPHGTGDP